MSLSLRDYQASYDRPVMALLDPRMWVPLFSRFKELHVKRSRSGMEFRIKGKTYKGKWMWQAGQIEVPSVTALRDAMNRSIFQLIRGAA